MTEDIKQGINTTIKDPNYLESFKVYLDSEGKVELVVNVFDNKDRENYTFYTMSLNMYSEMGDASINLGTCFNPKDLAEKLNNMVLSIAVFNAKHSILRQ